MKKRPHPQPIADVLRVMARLRGPGGCPWDREQTHRSLKMHAVEEVYELIDAIDAGDDPEMIEELGDLLLQVVFHCQLARERGAFDFDTVCSNLAAKLVRRHPHVFGDARASTVDAVWAQWERIKHKEKAGTRHHRPSALDGIPRHLPALMRAEKLVKKARKAGLITTRLTTRQSGSRASGAAAESKQLGAALFRLAARAQARGWSAEQLLATESRRQERSLRQRERRQKPQSPP